MFSSERLHIADLDDVELGAVRHQTYAVSDLKAALSHADIYDYSKVTVIVGVEYQRAKRCVLVAVRTGDIGYYAVEHLVDVDTGFCRNRRTALCGNSDYVLDFGAHLVNVRARQVDFVYDRHYLEVVLYREICVRESLRLDSLCRVDYQQRALTGVE